jgi:hypothetical protein
MTIGSGPGAKLNTHDTARTRAIVGHELLAQPLR